MWKVIRYRRGQAALIVTVAALMTACAGFGPLYERAIQQSLAGVKLSQAPVEQRGLALTVRAPSKVDEDADEDLGLVPDEHAVAGLMPDDLAGYFEEPSTLRSVTVVSGPNEGDLVSGSAVCTHLTFRNGACPDRLGEVAVSTAAAEGHGWRVGNRVKVAEPPMDGKTDPSPAEALTVVGVYDVRPGDYWFGRPVTGRSGGAANPETGRAPIDDLIVAEATFGDSEQARPWVGARMTTSFPLAVEKVRVDDLMLLGERVEALGAEVVDPAVRESWHPSARVSLHTALPALADEVDRGREQARIVVPLLMAQLAVLALVVLWLVLSAAVTQRRPELALAHLRGRGARGAGWWLIRELLPLVLTGYAVGCAAALGLSWVARHQTLPSSPPYEVPTAAVVAAGVALVVLLGALGLAVLRVAREPVSSLLRRVPARRSGWAANGAEGVLLTGSMVIVVAFAGGWLTGPMAVVAPPLLALSVGIGLAHLVTASAAALGQRLLRRGRYVAAVGAAMVARQPSTRQLITIVTIASALLVFSADALMTAERNRADAAAQQNGAAVRATVIGQDLLAVRRALADVDPDGDRVTPVVRMTAPGSGTVTDAVVPDQYRRIALFPGQRAADLPWDKLALPTVSPLRLTGTSLRLRLDSEVQITSADADSSAPVLLNVTTAAGAPLSVELGSVPPGSRSQDLEVHLPCRRGCTVTAIGVRSSVAEDTSGSLMLSRLKTERGPVALGDGDDWQRGSDTDTMITPTGDGADGVELQIQVAGGITALTRHGAAPALVPAFLSGVPDDVQGLGLDGVARQLDRVTKVPRLPAGAPATVLVNLDTISRDGTLLEAAAGIRLLFADDDPAFVAKVDAALRRHGSAIAQRTTLTEVREDLDDSAAAWAIELAVVVGAASIGLAGLAMLVVAATTVRRRSFDLAALRMSGVRPAAIRRVVLGEQLAVAIVAALAGATCGVVGAHLALPDIPIFAVAPKVSTLDLSTAWLAVLVAAAASVLALTLVGGLVARAAGRRANLLRLRESL